MCTVTVRRSDGSSAALIVTMNRDERRDRAPELEPKIYTSGLYPLDSEAGGTWFGVNRQGICLSLLNRYDAIDYEAKRSRGLLIPELLVHSSIADIKVALANMNLTDFAPFTLMINSYQTCDIAQWTGQDFILQHPMVTEYMHLSSSSWQTDKVLPWRQDHFDKWLAEGAAHHDNALPLYNLDQPEGMAKYAPLVSRENAFTKSITQYHCQDGEVHSRYWSESALPDGQAEQLTMPLHTV